MARSAIDETSDTGAFKRTASTFRVLHTLKIKGLEKAIAFTSVKPIWERTKESDKHMGWVFPASETEEAGAEPDPLNGARSIRELYELCKYKLCWKVYGSCVVG
ncbi:hypothetical protein OIU77_007352 [Salix suchowensis]|uniref:Uncharacterized protein n=1 Tax=Salix suchowensis TaxID=1278906 RepID=A0ABQ9AGJ5_9ROSI|nr:hypothetical protein OIU77_007352 [Salix suchowensis]